jgi:hypothetical protein
MRYTVEIEVEGWRETATLVGRGDRFELANFDERRGKAKLFRVAFDSRGVTETYLFADTEREAAREAAERLETGAFASVLLTPETARDEPREIEWVVPGRLAVLAEVLEVEEVSLVSGR